MKSVTVKEFDRKDHSDLVESFAVANWILQRIAVFMIMESSSKSKDKALTKSQSRAVSTQLIASVGTGKAVETLLSPLSLLAKEAVILSRTYFDGILVASYVALDNEAADRANLAQTYDQFRKQTQYRKMGDFAIKLSRQPRIPRRHTQVDAAIKEFDPNGSGKPKPSLGIDRFEAIKRIHERNALAGLLLHSAEGIVYDVASQLAHSDQAGLDQYFFTGSNNNTEEERCTELAFISLSSCMLSLRVRTRSPVIART